ncbi:MAG TPA: hypothetical protein VFS02_18670 [Telluria sp.]|nr:hypothetical protein [Telluria sp.]
MKRLTAFGAGLLLCYGACAAAEQCPEQVRVSLPNFEIAPFVLGTDKVESPPGLLIEWTRQALARSGCTPHIVIMRRPPNRQLAEAAMGLLDVLPGFAADGNQGDQLIFPTQDGAANAALSVMTDTVSLYARANDMRVRWDGATLRSTKPLVGSSTGGATTDAIARAFGWRIEPAPTPQADLRKLIAGRIDVILEPDVVLSTHMTRADARAVRRLLPPVRVTNRYAPVSHHFYQAYPEFTERFWREMCRQSRAASHPARACF